MVAVGREPFCSTRTISHPLFPFFTAKGPAYWYMLLVSSFAFPFIHYNSSSTDYIGIWNERNSDATYVKTLRKMLDKAGFSKTTIVAADGGSDICNDLHADADYASAVGIIGLHYPSDYR